MMKIEGIFTDKAPSPAGHYRQAVRHGNTLYISGQLGVAKGTPDPEQISVTEQVNFALNNIDAILRAAGSGRDMVIKTTVYVTDISQWDEANQAYAGFFGGHQPARAVVPCKALHLGSKIEIEAIAAIDSAE